MHTTLIEPTALATRLRDRKSTRLNSSHDQISYAVFCLKKKKKKKETNSESILKELNHMGCMQKVNRLPLDPIRTVSVGALLSPTAVPTAKPEKYIYLP